MSAARITELEARVASLKDRLRESSGVIKLLTRGKSPKQIQIYNAVVDRNDVAMIEKNPLQK